ncbi:predicted protein [Naegleria gruberi]|uniref:Predicted protein n=1 Tax=Naegleria gruberi TaxID=5762 RepID=D2VWM1_NAEGR|nr:uncharacterized protein NAEGRDRAFT_73428 [Naegleria gruberi]EFC38646.1 predicted protein [Naegleria gruberi]|eukprot:XP_002671390.1 predicted protein [Naegleria gruberi strain NEG-M]
MKNNDNKPEPYDPFNLFEYDNRAIALQTLQRINDNLLNNNTSNISSALNYQDINNGISPNSSVSSFHNSSSRRRASISSSSLTPRSLSTSNNNRKSPRQLRETTPSSQQPSAPVKRTISNQSSPSKFSSVSGSSTTPRHNVFNRSNSDSQTISNHRPSNSKRRASIGGMGTSNCQQHENNCICSHCGHEMKLKEEKKPLITPTNEIFKALTEIEYEQALKQSMKGMDKVNLNDEEQLDLVAEILSETLLKNDGLSLSSKRKQKLKKATHFSQTETYFENRIDNRPSQTIEKQFDFTNCESTNKTNVETNQQLVNSNIVNNNNRNAPIKKKPNIQIFRNIEEKNISPLDEECKLISEPFITIQNNRMNFYPNEPTRIAPVSRKKDSRNIPSSKQPIYNEQKVQSRKSSPQQTSSVTENNNETQTNAYIEYDTNEDQPDSINTDTTSDDDNMVYRDKCLNTDDCLIMNEEIRNELYENAKRKGQDEIVRMYINSKLKERLTKQSKRSDRKSSLSFLFPGLYKKIQTDLKLKRLESTDPYKKPMNNIIQEMKSLVERC